MPSQPKYERSFEIRVIGPADFMTNSKKEVLSKEEVIEGIVRHSAEEIKAMYPELHVLTIQTILDQK